MNEEMPWSPTDVAGMQSALAQAAAAGEIGEVPVGAVVVIEDEIAGVGHNRTIADQDPSAHAEILALRAAAAARGNHRLPGATVYVTLEPCLMCLGALAQARVRRIVFGAYDPLAGAAGSAIDLSESTALNHHPEINGGLLAEACGERLTDFFASRR